MYSRRPPAFRPGTQRDRRAGHQQQGWLGIESAGKISAGWMTAGLSIAELWPMDRTVAAATAAAVAAISHVVN